MLIRFKRYFSQTRATLLGNHCAACDTQIWSSPVCQACTPNDTVTRCPRCAIAQSQSQLCGACITQTPPYHQSYCLGGFNPPLSDLIAQLKFYNRTQLAPWFAAQLQQQLKHHPFDAVVPMPLHPNRLRSRGFNQSVEIAKHLPYPMLLALERIRDTPSQRHLNAIARFKNVKGAFYAPKPLTNLSLLLLDDVVTTTATIHAASQALLQAGAAQVSVACIARVS